MKQERISPEGKDVIMAVFIAGNAIRSVLLMPLHGMRKKIFIRCVPAVISVWRSVLRIVWLSFKSCVIFFVGNIVAQAFRPDEFRQT